MYVALRHRRQNGAQLADFVYEGADKGLALELGSRSTITRNGVVGGDCAKEPGASCDIME